MMNLKAWSLLLLTGGLLVCPALGQQEQAAADQPSAQHSADRSPSATEPQKKLTLSDVTRISTSEAARHAAEEVAGRHASKGKAAVGRGAAGAPGVVEFQPAGAEGRDAVKSLATVPAKNGESKSPLKNVHGSAYGALDAHDAGNQESAASVGASSKGGKTAIYVETDHARATSPSPH